MKATDKDFDYPSANPTALDRFFALLAPVLDPASQLLQTLGGRCVHSFIGRQITLILRALWALPEVFRTGIVQSQAIWQIFFTGVEIIPIVVLLSALMGTGVTNSALMVMPTVGFGDYFGTTMVAVVVRELSPVFTAMLIAGRTGAALTTHIGYMKVESEIDALETMGIDPMRYIVLPAVVGCCVSLFVLNIVFTMAGTLGGLLFTKILHAFESSVPNVDMTIYLESFFHALEPFDLVLMAVKPVVFGLVIAIIASLNGLHIGNDPRLVPQASSSTVVRCFLAIVSIDIFFSSFYITQYLDKIQNII